jgi:hypothetical protein
MTDAVTIVPMPQMGVSVIEGTVGAWHKAVGDAVAEGEPLCDIVTDKVDTEVTSPVDGVDPVRIDADRAAGRLAAGLTPRACLPAARRLVRV